MDRALSPPAPLDSMTKASRSSLGIGTERRSTILADEGTSIRNCSIKRSSTASSAKASIVTPAGAFRTLPMTPSRRATR